MDAKVFGQFIALTRKERNMTQAELAAQIGVTDKAVSRWERGVGFPDINTLEPLAKALGVTVPELMRSEKDDMDKKSNELSETEITEMMAGAVEMAKENQRQDKTGIWLGGAVVLTVTALIVATGHGSLGGGLVAGGIAAMAVLGIYYLIQNREDKESRKIYSFFALLGIAMCLTTLHLFGVDSFLTAWGMYGLLGFILGKLNQ